MPTIPTLADLTDEYNRRYSSMKLLRGREARDAARRLSNSRSRYEAVSHETGVPWEVIAALHNRESGGDFRGVLHNGEHIIGTGRKTKLVPSGRGPFKTWEEAAIDALRIKRLHQVRVWDIPRILYTFESFNGWGYRWYRGIASPYLWSGTDQYKAGKYVADGKWDARAVDQQLGAVPVYFYLKQLQGAATPESKAEPAPVPEPGPQPEKPSLAAIIISILAKMFGKS